MRDHAQERYGKLTAIKPLWQNARHQYFWLCQCDCGGWRVVRSCKLTGGVVTRCRECRPASSRGPEYPAWVDMRKRCDNPKHKDYPYYGGRGIRVCGRWADFAAFIEDMGLRPSPQHSLDRIDNNGNYEKDNCRWATRAEQNRNKRSNVLITHNGETKCVADWAALAGMERITLSHRIKRGWSFEAAITTPVRRTTA